MTGGRLAARWLALAAYVAAVYAFLPFGPRVGYAVAATATGAWLLGPGVILLAVAGTVAAIVVVVRRRAPLRCGAMLAGAGVGYVVAFSWLRAQHLERTHLPEYGIASWLAWRAIAPSLPGRAGYVAAAVLAAAVGYGDELLQKIVPGRVYDLRDVAMNAVGAALGAIVIAAVATGRASARRATDGSSARR